MSRPINVIFHVKFEITLQNLIIAGIFPIFFYVTFGTHTKINNQNSKNGLKDKVFILKKLTLNLLKLMEKIIITTKRVGKDQIYKYSNV